MFSFLIHFNRSVYFTKKYVPETTGMTLEEIEDKIDIETRMKDLQSKGCNRALLAKTVKHVEYGAVS
jgi:hypothetical protein